MRWSEYEKTMKSLSEMEKKILDQKAHLVNAIVQRRRMLGLTQEQVAQKIGTKQPAIARFENTGQIPSLDLIQKVAYALGLRLELVPDEENEQAAAKATQYWKVHA